MKRWPIEFFKDKTGSRPVQHWLDGLPDEVRGKVLARIELLAEHGPTLDHPYTSQIEGKLREVRLRFGKTRYRVLYFLTNCGLESCSTDSQKTLRPWRKLTKRLDACA
jgi:phage-related protein